MTLNSTSSLPNQLAIARPQEALSAAVAQRLGRYNLRLARTEADAQALYRLRFEVFNLELNEGLAASYQTGLDQDRHDQFCHHLLVEDSKSGEVVGTYRLQTYAMARLGPGFYSQAEFDLNALGIEVLDDAVELGRACIDENHRNSRVLFLLWRGLAAYMVASQKRFFFGCCSLTSTHGADGHALYASLVDSGHVSSKYRAPVQQAYRCPNEGDASADVKIPKLMRLYLTYGATIVSAPALDQEFKTIDYLALFDMQGLTDVQREVFLAPR
ncbi:MAG: GNAT family N-acyltransferase [Pseudomonadota bacterium]